MRSWRQPGPVVGRSVALLITVAACADDMAAPTALRNAGVATNEAALDITITELGSYPGGGTMTGVAINNNGRVAGSVFTGGVGGIFAAATWDAQNGVSLLPGVWGFEASGASDINARGDVVGFRSPTPGFGLLWTKGGGLFEVPEMNLAHAINNRGDVVGASKRGTAILRDRHGELHDLGGNFALDLNSRGEVVGRSAGHAAFWSVSGEMTMIPTEPVFRPSTATGINDAGEVVGFMGPPFQSLAFAWTQKAGVRMLETPPGWFSQAEAINNNGEVAGWITPGDADRREPVLWMRDGQFVPLPMPGGRFGAAGDINDRAEIVGGIWPAGGQGGRSVVWRVRPR